MHLADLPLHPRLECFSHPIVFIFSSTAIKISEVLLAVEEKVKTVGCEKHSKKACNGKSSKCITHNLWDELEGYINNFFEKKKLSDLISIKDNKI